MENKKSEFINGMKDGIPIGLGYFAVAFSLGIIAKTAGFTPALCFLASFLNHASAGEYALFTLAAATVTYTEVAIMTLVADARYLLMSTAISQKFKPNEKWYHRVLVGFGLTDELFGIAINKPGFLNPFYSYGAFLLAAPCWALGSSIGCIAGNIMPQRVVSALSVALYGMFIAIIVPPAKKNKVIAVLIVISFAISYAAGVLPVVKDISSGSRTIVLTVVIAALAAILFPKEDEEADNDTL